MGFSGQLQSGEGSLFILCRYERKLQLQPLVQIILSGEKASSNVTFEEACSPDSMICRSLLQCHLLNCK